MENFIAGMGKGCIFAAHLKFNTMVKIKFRLSSKPKQILLKDSKKTLPSYQVLVRLRHGAGGAIDLNGKTKVFALKSCTDFSGNKKVLWDNKNGEPKDPNWQEYDNVKKEEKQFQDDIANEVKSVKEKLFALKSEIEDAFKDAGSGKNPLPKDWLEKLLHKEEPKQEETEQQLTFFDHFNKYLADKKFAAHRETEYRVLERILKRYELYSGQELTFDNVTGDTLRDFEKYLYSEHNLYKDGKLDDIMKSVPESRKPQPRGENAVCDLMKKFRAFFRWANGLSKSERLTDNNPFDNYTMPQEKYGTPYYITIDERKQLYNAQLREPYATQRDIFVFQCLIGCRVSDLWSMTKENIINGKVQYIPSKTKDEKPETVTVPLTTTAKEILDRYKDWGGKSLFPFTSQQHYNLAIKEMFKMAGLDRVVTVLNPTTREEEKRPLYEVASSHMARRTFVGNLYKQVKDPNLICPMSGHKVGSKAFARYRAIDEDLMKETVNLLD